MQRQQVPGQGNTELWWIIYKDKNIGKDYNIGGYHSNKEYYEGMVDKLHERNPDKEFYVRNYAWSEGVDIEAELAEIKRLKAEFENKEKGDAKWKSKD